MEHKLVRMESAFCGIELIKMCKISLFSEFRYQNKEYNISILSHNKFNFFFYGYVIFSEILYTL